MMSLKARRRELRSNGFWVNFLGIIPLVWGCLLLFLVLWGLNVALGDPTTYLAMVREHGLFVGNYTIQNFIDVSEKFMIEVGGNNGILRMVTYPEMLMNSLVYSLGCTLPRIVVTTLFSYVTARYEFKGRKFLYAFIMVQMMIPTYGQDAAKYKMLAEMNMVDNWLYYISQGAGHGGLFLIMYAYFQGLPNAYAEAAKIDGAGPFAIFKNIMLPCAVPIITAQGIMNFIFYWNDYATVMVYQKTNPTLSSMLYVLQTYMFYIGLQTPTYFAGIFLSVIPVVVLYAIFSGKLNKNVSAGGIKG